MAGQRRKRQRQNQQGRKQRRGACGCPAVSKPMMVLMCLTLCWFIVEWRSPLSRRASRKIPKVAISAPTTSSSTYSDSNNHQHTLKSHRKFVSYHSSEWERLWLDHLATTWDTTHDFNNYSQSILKDQAGYVHDFLLATCTDRLPPPYSHWCAQNDSYRPFFYNTHNRSAFEWLCGHSPQAQHLMALLPQATSMGALIPGLKYDRVFSRMVVRDEFTGQEYVEYIEPLVAGLRHPLARLHYAGMPGPNQVLDFRGYIVPPPPPRVKASRNILVDAGATEWSSGKLGGPSLAYFVQVWKRHDIEWNEIYAYEPTTPVAAFHATVPDEYKARTKFWQTYIASSPETATSDQPFVPRFIQDELRPRIDDYVLWKLDIDSPDVELGSIQYLLEQPADKIHVDELAWEHHIKDHPVMGKIWAMGGGPPPAPVALRQSYEYFLKLRQKGIRAHSWV